MYVLGKFVKGLVVLAQHSTLDYFDPLELFALMSGIVEANWPN